MKEIRQIEYPDGYYLGETINGLHHGRGIYYFANGDRYEGNFIDANGDGSGIYYSSNGETFEGEFDPNGNYLKDKK